MTITIDLPQETLEALRTDAGTLGRPAEQLAAEYLVSLFALDEDEETVINEALDEMDAGNGRPFAEFAAELSGRFAGNFETP